MKHFLRLLVFTTVFLAALSVRAQAPFGAVAANLPYKVSKLLADPGRNRVYALVPSTNSLVIIDTTTLTAIATVPVGSQPADMALSPDNTTLYVANSGSNLSAVSVVNLATLKVKATFGLASAVQSIAAGLGDRVYAGEVGSAEDGIYQFDGKTGTVQATIQTSLYTNAAVRISPDGKKLFASTLGFSPDYLVSYDVSTPTATSLQINRDTGSNARELVLSHNGKYLCLPCGGGNGSGYSTNLFSTGDITSYYGTFDNGSYPGVLAFSPDDSLVYQVYEPYGIALQVFSTQSFAQVGQSPLPAIGLNSDLDEVPAVAVDRTGSYLFASDSDTYDTGTPSALVVLATGAGTLVPSTLQPVITGPTSVALPTSGPFSYQITASGHPTSYGATGLPGGLGINTKTGLISGTFDDTESGYIQVQVSASNASGTATANIELLAFVTSTSEFPTITTKILPDAVLGQPYSVAIKAANSPTQWSATNLPEGLKIDTSTGVISGTPTLFGPSLVTVNAINEFDTATAVFALNVLPKAPPIPAVTSLASATGAVGAAFTYQITATHTPTSYSATGLPAGLTINQGSGVISGVPTAAGTFVVTLSAINAAGTGTATLTLVITGTTVVAPVITSGSDVTANLGQLFIYQITADNSPTSYALVSGTLPRGLSLNTTTGLISGTPQDAGLAMLVVSASNLAGTGVSGLNLTVVIPIPAVTNTILSENVNVGQPFTYQITATNDPTSFGVLGLPEGLSVDPASGIISGTPTSVGVFALTLQAGNSYGIGTAAFMLAVDPVLPIVNIVATIPRVTAGSGEEGEITLSRTSGDTSSKLVVRYTVSGSAHNGADYVMLSGKKKIRPGQSNAIIHIVPIGTLAGESPKKVKVVLQAAGNYQLGSSVKAKVKIIPGE